MNSNNVIRIKEQPVETMLKSIMDEEVRALAVCYVLKDGTVKYGLHGKSMLELIGLLHSGMAAIDDEICEGGSYE